MQRLIIPLPLRFRHFLSERRSIQRLEQFKCTQELFRNAVEKQSILGAGHMEQKLYTSCMHHNCRTLEPAAYLLVP